MMRTDSPSVSESGKNDMRGAYVLVVLFVLAASPTHAQQSAPLKSCPLLDLPDAAVVTGRDVQFQSGLEIADQTSGQKLYLCFFGVGYKRTLTLKTVPTLGEDAAAYKRHPRPARSPRASARRR